MAVQKFTLVVEKNVKETPTVWIIMLRFKEKVEFDFKPGQYIMIDIPVDGAIKKRAYSIASSPLKKDFIELGVKKIEGGTASGYLCNLKEGDEINAMGPMGFFMLKEPFENDMVFLASGSGICPLRCMLQYLFEKRTDKTVWLFFGVRTEDEIVYRKEFEELAEKHSNFKFVPVLSRQEWDGEQGHVQEVMKKYITDPKGKEAYICGLTKMVEETKNTLLKMGFSNEQIHHEKYV